MSDTLKCISPIDGKLVVERGLASAAEAARAVETAARAQAQWRRVPLAQRQAICAKFAEAMIAKKERLGEDLTRQMGRPIRYTPSEIGGGMAERKADRGLLQSRPGKGSPEGRYGVAVHGKRKEQNRNTVKRAVRENSRNLIL
jgi:acyl-CoA reductase-like NAD-dependent aldehyde dehydrogenase